MGTVWAVGVWALKRVVIKLVNSMTTLEYILAKQRLRLDRAVEDLLLVDRFQDLTPAPDRRLYKCLTLTQVAKAFWIFRTSFLYFLRALSMFSQSLESMISIFFPLFWDCKDRCLGEY